MSSGNQYITTWKLKPGSEQARAVELLRFLPEGTELRTSDLCKRINTSRDNFAQRMSPVTRRGLVKCKRRQNATGLGSSIFWMAGDGAPHHGPATDSAT